MMLSSNYIYNKQFSKRTVLRPLNYVWLPGVLDWEKRTWSFTFGEHVGTYTASYFQGTFAVQIYLRER